MKVKIRMKTVMLIIQINKKRILSFLLLQNLFLGVFS